MMSVMAGRATVVTMLAWRAAISKYGVWSRQMRPSAKVKKRVEKG